jgi:NADPH-dependent glutamate synthase beta subunit-like oxidoreductase/2,4-dienoyl-CoA reductase-like NADH-dependent reductase (Old Yellow Enzyme family)
MASTKRFSYRSLDELKRAISRRGHDLPTSDDFSVLGEPVRWGRLTIPNRLAVQPMEGCDATTEGSPTALTVRRYRRFAAGGAGLVWWEACAVVPEGRANPHQLYLHDANADAFADALQAAHAAAEAAVGRRCVCVLQLTHSGRYSRPDGHAAPVIAHHSPVLDPRHSLPRDYPLISDEELDALQEAFVSSARLAAEVGFDAVDIKACHRYLLSELLASFTREGSRYGGVFENRTRMLRETAARVRDALGDRLEVTSRLNVHDGIAYPYGWGAGRDGGRAIDLAEPLRLVGELAADGMSLLNVTAGNPYFNPHVNRPADWAVAHWPDPPEHPLDGVSRLADLAREVQQSQGEVAVVSSGLSWLRQYVPYFAAGAVRAGWAQVVGLGRGALAYPDFAKDILDGRGMDRHKVCIACSSCTQIMRDGGRSGCAVRDAEVYAPILRAGRRRDPAVMRELAARCRQCVGPMCETGCPAGVDIPAFLGALADGDDKLAYDILRSRNVLPMICGAVCPAEVRCESRCIQRVLSDAPVPIAELHRHLARRAVDAGWAAVELPPDASGATVAVVGAGPAGLAAAAELLRRGHRVEVFERSRRRGGKLGSVIPTTRLTEAEAQGEIHAVLGRVPPDRLAWRYGRALGADMTLDDLLGRFAAVVLATGLGGGSPGAGKGPRPAGVMDASAFLRQMAHNPEHVCPPRVAVLGGGNTAADAAVAAKAHEARDVYLVYRRSFADMPAWPGERAEVLQAGVHVLLLCEARGFETDAGGRLRGVRLLRTTPGEADASGRRTPVAAPGGEFVLEVDVALEALGERAEAWPAGSLGGVALTAEGLIAADEDTLATTRRGVWAAGDVVNGGTTVVRAVAEGRRAAEGVDAHLLGVRGR